MRTVDFNASTKYLVLYSVHFHSGFFYMLKGLWEQNGLKSVCSEYLISPQMNIQIYSYGKNWLNEYQNIYLYA